MVGRGEEGLLCDSGSELLLGRRGGVVRGYYVGWKKREEKKKNVDTAIITAWPKGSFIGKVNVATSTAFL